MADAPQFQDKFITPPPSANGYQPNGRNSRSFFLVDSSTYKPHFSNEPVTVVFSNGQDMKLPAGGLQVADEEPHDYTQTTSWSRFRCNYQDFFSEFWGTFILIMFGDGVVAQFILAEGENGDWQSIPWSWAIGVLIGAYVARRSGSHLNPAVTLTFCIFRKFSWKKLPIYVIAQVLGALIASITVYGTYKSAFDNFAGPNHLITQGSGIGNETLATAGIFATYPAPFLSPVSQFVSELVATALLLFSVFALTDEGNLGAGPFLPIGLFFVIFGIGSSFGFQTGFAINPARDFGPRLASYILGYGTSVFTVAHHYFWVPIVAPCVGAIVGALLYDLFIFQGETPLHKPWLGLRKRSYSQKRISPV